MSLRQRKNEQQRQSSSSQKQIDAQKEHSEDKGIPIKETSPDPTLHHNCLINLMKVAILIIVVPPVVNLGALQKEETYLLNTLGGQMYDVGGGRQQYLSCKGQGSPTVVFDSATGQSSAVWLAMQKDIQNHTTACVYDRAGLGFSHHPRNSQPVTGRHHGQPYTSESAIDDLHQLLTMSSSQGRPFILVGHEIGALNMAAYTKIYSGNRETENTIPLVSDLVLIDPFPAVGLLDESGDLNELWWTRIVPSLQAYEVAAMMGISRALILLGLSRSPLSEYAASLADENLNVTAALMKHLMCKSSNIRGMIEEHMYVNESLHQYRTLLKLGPLPAHVGVSVVTAGRQHSARMSPEENEAWRTRQDLWLSSTGWETSGATSARLQLDGDGMALPLTHSHHLTQVIRQLVDRWRSDPRHTRAAPEESGDKPE